MYTQSRIQKIVIIVLIVIFGGTFAFYAAKQMLIKIFFAHYQPPPVSVSTTQATAKTWSPTLTAVGTLTAVNGVDVTTQVNGQVTAINFQSGQMVQKDQSLVQLDDSLDQQTLNNDMAQLKLDQMNYERNLKLARQNMLAQSDLDSAQAKMVQSQANVATAQLNISHKNIKAPFAGKVGIRNINLGQFVTAGQALVSLQSMDPMYVDFQLPEQDLTMISVGQTVQLTFDAFPGKVFKGVITAFDSKIDVNTRTLAVRATIPNQSQELYPGLFTNIAVLLPQQNNVLTVPQTAVTYSLYGNTIYIVTQKGVDKKNKPILVAIQRFVTLGDRRDDEVQILSGLQPNEVVVTAGQLKLHNGSIITINNSLKLD